MASKVTVVGSINIDLVSQVARFPQPGETVLGGDLRSIPGGKGANQAVAAARLGAQVAMVGRVGDDSFAEGLKSNLVNEGINVSQIQSSSNTASGTALILVNDAGQNYIVVAPGANGRVNPTDVDGAKELIASAHVLLLQLEIPLSSVFRAAQIAHNHGVRVILNPAPAQHLASELLTLVDILVPNESEARMLLGEAGVLTNIATAGGLAAVANQLRSRGSGVVIITAGSLGAIVADGESVRRFPAFAITEIVDTTAAGDAFAGGLATAIGAGKSLAEAVLWGNAAGALTVTQAGAQPSLPSWADMDSLLADATVEQRLGVKL